MRKGNKFYYFEFLVSTLSCVSFNPQSLFSFIFAMLTIILTITFTITFTTNSSCTFPSPSACGMRASSNAQPSVFSLSQVERVPIDEQQTSPDAAVASLSLGFLLLQKHCCGKPLLQPHSFSGWWSASCDLAHLSGGAASTAATHLKATKDLATDSGTSVQMLLGLPLGLTWGLVPCILLSFPNLDVACIHLHASKGSIFHHLFVIFEPQREMHGLKCFWLCLLCTALLVGTAIATNTSVTNNTVATSPLSTITITTTTPPPSLDPLSADTPSTMSVEEVISEVESIFGLSDGSTLQSQGDAAIQVVLGPLLQRFEQVECPAFTTPEEWDHGTPMFRVCLYAVLGRLVMGNITFEEGDLQEHAQCRFVLDPQTGMLVNGDAARELSNGGQAVATTHTIMSVLVIVLLVSMGLMLFMHNRWTEEQQAGGGNQESAKQK